MRLISTFAPLACLMFIAACAAPQPPAPAPRVAPSAPTPPPPPRPVAQPSTDWRDIPLTPGDWRYRQDGDGSEAVFALSGGGPAFIFRCDRTARGIQLVRPVGGGSQLRITTSSTRRALPGSPDAGGVSATLPASDPLLDAMVFSRGRFTVESESGAMLVIPAWPEPARVVEDCR
jgi:hypothetical protein